MGTEADTGDAVNLDGDFVVTVDAGSVAAADLNTINGKTSGLVTATAATTITGTVSALTTLIKMKPYISKTLLENPNPENIAFNNAFEAELKCTNGKISNHRVYIDPACHPISNMDIRLQEAQIQLAKDELAKGNDLSDNDFKCNVQVDFASIWSRKLKKEAENAISLCLE